MHNAIYTKRCTEGIGHQDACETFEGKDLMIEAKGSLKLTFPDNPKRNLQIAGKSLVSWV